jgi:hypothetical protein
MIWDKCWSISSIWSSVRDRVRDKNWKRSYTWPILFRTSLRFTFWYIRITRTRLNFQTYISYQKRRVRVPNHYKTKRQGFKLTHKIKICSYALFTGPPVNESCRHHILNCKTSGVKDGDFITFSTRFLSNDHISQFSMDVLPF